METERFEALVDAILAIIITIIVLEIPMASNGSWEALFNLRYEFIIYIISFIVCFNFWNFNNNLFSVVYKINSKVIWTMGITLFVFSLLPYMTTFVAENFYNFFSQFIYGFCFIITSILIKFISKLLKDSDPVNVVTAAAHDIPEVRVVLGCAYETRLFIKCIHNRNPPYFLSHTGHS